MLLLRERQRGFFSTPNRPSAFCLPSRVSITRLKTRGRGRVAASVSVRNAGDASAAAPLVVMERQL